MAEWTMPEWMEPYRDFIGNTGGNSIEELVNDKGTNSFHNSIRAALIVAVTSQIHLLHKLRQAGLLIPPGPICEAPGGCLKDATGYYRLPGDEGPHNDLQLCDEHGDLAIGDYPDIETVSR